MFEAYTRTRILDDMLALAPAGVDTREGSIFYDAVIGVANRIAKLYTDLDLVFTLTQLWSTVGEELDVKASEYGITRHAATPAKYYFTYTGTMPEVGERFFYDGIYFVLQRDASQVLYLQCEDVGAKYNTIAYETPVVPVNNIDGLTSATIGAVVDNEEKTLFSPGTDDESDDSLRSRIQSKIAGPAENGNKNHYKAWCEEADDKVGIARITPLWNGPNTVKAVLIDHNGTPCGSDTVAKVQAYVDPATSGQTVTIDGTTYVVGDGLGEGVANLGAHFTAAPASPKEITVAATVEPASGYDVASAQAEATTALGKYIKALVLSADTADEATVRYVAVGAVLAGLPSVKDYSNLTINSATINVVPGADEVPVLKAVNFSAV